MTTETPPRPPMRRGRHIPGWAVALIAVAVLGTLLALTQLGDRPDCDAFTETANGWSQANPDFADCVRDDIRD